VPLLDEAIASAPDCRLTTTGRRSGRPHEVKLWFATIGDRIVLLASERDAADWVRNLIADPRVTVRIAGQRFEGRAQVLEGTNHDPVAREAMAAKYGTRWLTRWLREGLAVAVDLQTRVLPDG
jgi:deazaflavin-dependent oxidoreductase (nitroreductase family)